MLFGQPTALLPYSEGEKLDLLFNLSVNEYKGQGSVQLLIKNADLAASSKKKREAEKEEFLAICHAHEVDLISMIAPTSKDRIAMIAREAEGFLYIVSSMGVTGTRRAITTDVGAIVEIVRQHTDLPCAIGFGISTPEQAQHMAQYADGVIVGSAIVKIVERYGRDAAPHVGAYVREMKTAIND